MTSPVRRRGAALLAAAALIAGPVVTAAPALADGSTDGTATCTITAAQRAEATDQLTALRARFVGHKPTAAEKVALNAAIAELKAATRHARMSTTVRAAKKVELARLAKSLKTARSAEQRTAIRVEMRAIRSELAAARPTRAQQRSLGRAIQDLKVALRAKPTKAEKRLILAQIKAVKAVLACQTAEPTPSTPDTTTGTTTGTTGTSAS